MSNVPEGRVWRRVSLTRFFFLRFARELGDEDDHEMWIGVYRTEDDAKAAIARVVRKNDFVGFPDGFQICRCDLNVGHWTGDCVVGDTRRAAEERINWRARAGHPRRAIGAFLFSRREWPGSLNDWTPRGAVR